LKDVTWFDLGDLKLANRGIDVLAEGVEHPTSQKHSCGTGISSIDVN
jgi:hypothetical protein